MTWHVFRHTKRLALSISHSSVESQGALAPSQDSAQRGGVRATSRQVRDQDPMTWAAGQRNVTQLVELLNAFPYLGSLDLRWLSLEEQACTQAHAFEQNFLDSITKQADLARLTSITLQGLRTNPESLILFFKKHPQLESIELHTIFFNRPWSRIVPVLKYFNGFV